VDWPGLVRKYVWDEEKTPYLVRSDRLSPRQARSELFVYAFLLAILAAVIAVVAAAGGDRVGLPASPAIALYAGTLLVAAVVLAVSAHPTAAGYCATAPLAVGVAAVLGALRPGMDRGEIVFVAALSLLWLGYAARVVRVARRLRGLS
jgi:pheromone shutdown protein TraB